jgi:hypothetical protein
MKLYEAVTAGLWPRQLADAAEPPPAPIKAPARLREAAGLAKERLLLGVPRRLRNSGFRRGPRGARYERVDSAYRP